MTEAVETLPKDEAVAILVEHLEFLYLNDEEGTPRHVRIALDVVKGELND